MNLFLAMLGVGIVSSIHCVAMCGSMVLTYAVKGDAEGPLLKRMLPHFAYHGAKLTSYVATGLVLGAIGAAFNLGGIRGWVTVAAGAFMIFLGLQMTGKFPVLARFTPRPPKLLMQAISRTRKKAVSDAEDGHSSLATPITFGLMTGFMPCGPLQGAQIAAAAAGSPLAGGLGMLGFGLGTMPLMLGFGAVSGMLGAKFKQRMMVFAALLVMGLGLVMVDRGAMLLGSPVTSQAIKQVVFGTPAPAVKSDFRTATDGVVEVSLVIENTRFVPDVLDLPADKPVRIVVDRRESNACSAQLAIPQLGVLANLKDNAVTKVDVPAIKAGALTLTCGMGMMAGTVRVGGAPATGRGSNWLVWLLSALVAGALLLAYRSRRKHETKRAQVAHGRRSAAGGRVPTLEAGAALGFSQAEALTVAAVLVAAVLLGLAAGGYFG